MSSHFTLTLGSQCAVVSQLYMVNLQKRMRHNHLIPTVTMTSSLGDHILQRFSESLPDLPCPEALSLVDVENERSLQQMLGTNQNLLEQDTGIHEKNYRKIVGCERPHDRYTSQDAVGKRNRVRLKLPATRGAPKECPQGAQPESYESPHRPPCLHHTSES